MEKDFIEKKLEQKAIDSWNHWEDDFKKLLLIKIGPVLPPYMTATEKLEKIGIIYEFIFGQLDKINVYSDFVKNETNLHWNEINSNIQKLSFLFDGVINPKIEEEEVKKVKEGEVKLVGKNE